ncbi:hypothetical protein R1flu_013915 [Riccia fluitans]|uniref:Uncharacterized protein n=1 Tax=Riccia fluitans TaxID=41844 RepID=A0ABD1YI32_9MARC
MVLVMLVLEEDKGFKTLTLVMESERAAELASLHDMESTSPTIDEEEREIELAFPSSIWGEPSSSYAGGPQGSDARPHKSNFSSSSSVANAGTHFDSNPIFS